MHGDTKNDVCTTSYEKKKKKMLQRQYYDVSLVDLHVVVYLPLFVVKQKSPKELMPFCQKPVCKILGHLPSYFTVQLR